MTAALVALVGLGIAANAARRVARVRTCSRTKDIRRVTAQYVEWVASTGLITTAVVMRFHLPPAGVAAAMLGVGMMLIVIVNGANAITRHRNS